MYNRNWIGLLVVLMSGWLAAANATPPPSDTGSTGAVVQAKKPSTEAPGKKININTAGVADFDTLPGIGLITAQKIAAYRQEHGKFQKLEDLMSVKGIGPKKFERFKSMLTIE